MRFLHDGMTHSVSRITGPTHNWLAVTFAGESDVSEPQIIELPPVGDCKHKRLDSAKVLAAVLAGVAEGNRDLGMECAVASVRYIANDTGPEEVYRSMAQSLVVEVVRHSSQQHSAFPASREGRTTRST